jgi:hypothetical protein
MKIWRYEIESGSARIFMPRGAKILSAQSRDDIVRLWAMVDPSKDLLPRHFVAVMTGQELDFHKLEYISTVQLHGGKVVAHVFEVFP